MIEERRQRAMVRIGSSEARFEILQNRDSVETFWGEGKHAQFLTMWKGGSQLHRLALVWRCQPLHFLIERLERIQGYPLSIKRILGTS
jgi:hypothetical protein